METICNGSYLLHVRSGVNGDRQSKMTPPGPICAKIRYFCLQLQNIYTKQTKTQVLYHLLVRISYHGITCFYALVYLKFAEEEAPSKSFYRVHTSLHLHQLARGWIILLYIF